MSLQVGLSGARKASDLLERSKIQPIVCEKGDNTENMTQALAHETNIYLYGVDRIGEQQPDGWVYSPGDALG